MSREREMDQALRSDEPGSRRFRDLIARERSDMGWLVHVVACMYDEISGGRISKPTTYPHEVISQFEERLNEACDEAVAEERERITEAVQGLLIKPNGYWVEAMSEVISQAAVVAIVNNQEVTNG